MENLRIKIYTLERIIYRAENITLCKICLRNRIITFVSNEIAFWQRAYLEKRDRQELIFLLKTEIDNFRHLSTKIIVTFINFTDAFGSVSHEIIFEVFSIVRGSKTGDSLSAVIFITVIDCISNQQLMSLLFINISNMKCY